MGFGVLAVAGLVYWVASLSTRLADTPPLAPSGWLAVTTSRGSLALSSGLWANVDVLDEIAKSPGLSPPLDRDVAWSVPGFRMRAIRLTGDATSDWALEVSMLLPILVSGVLAVVCVRRYRALRRHSDSESRPGKVALDA